MFLFWSQHSFTSCIKKLIQIFYVDYAVFLLTLWFSMCTGCAIGGSFRLQWLSENTRSILITVSAVSVCGRPVTAEM